MVELTEEEKKIIIECLLEMQTLIQMNYGNIKRELSERGLNFITEDRLDKLADKIKFSDYEEPLKDGF